MHRGLVAALLFFSVNLVAKPVLLNGVAATVGQTVITVQDALVYRALQRLREGKKPAVVYEQGTDLSRTVQKLMFEQMVFAESKSLDFEGASEADLKKDWAKLAKSSSELASVQKAFSVPEAELKKRFQKTLTSERFLQKKMDTLTPIITDSEVQRYVKVNEERFKNRNWEEYKPSIVALLKKERTEKGLEDWIRFLTQKYGAASQLE